MGKALIFPGVTFLNPIQKVSFIQTLDTAEDYVEAYSNIATEVTSSQKTALVTLVDMLMDAGIWHKVKGCWPMLGGLTGYTTDLKDIYNQHEFAMASESLSWDSTRNAPYLYSPGFAAGTELTLDGMDYTNSAYFCSVKTISGNYILCSKYKYISIHLTQKNGGWNYPSWMTTAQNENVTNYSTKKNSNNAFFLNRDSSVNTLSVYSNSSTLIKITEEENTMNSIFGDDTAVSFAFGDYYAADASAPAGQLFYGTINVFMAFNSALTDDEQQTVASAVWELDESLGRHIDFE